MNEPYEFESVEEQVESQEARECPKCACANCKSYGFPCLNCAEGCYDGALGPGFFTPSERIFIRSDNVYNENVERWINEHPGIAVLKFPNLQAWIAANQAEEQDDE